MLLIFIFVFLNFLFPLSGKEVLTRRLKGQLVKYSVDEPRFQEVIRVIEEYRENPKFKTWQEYYLACYRAWSSQRLFSSAGETVGLYSASGPDILSLLLAGNVEKAYLVDRLKFIAPEDILSDPRLARGYFTQKIGAGYLASVFLRQVLNLNILAPVLWELFLLGVDDIELFKFNYHGKELVKLNFSWAHPEEGIEKEREIILIGDTDVVFESEYYLELIKERINIYMEKAFDPLPSEDYPRKSLILYRTAIVKFLIQGGIILNDTSPKAFLNTIDLPQRDKLKLLPSSAEIMELERKGLRFGHGEVRIYEKVDE